MRGFKSIDRITKQLTKTIPFSSENVISEKISRLWSEHKSLKYGDYEFRAQNLLNFHDLLQDNQEEIAKIISSEMGKSVDEAREEVNRCMIHAKYFVDDLYKWKDPKKKKDSLNKSKFMHALDSKGVMLKIVPFNSPLWVGLKMAIPSIALGNSVLIRPPETCPRMGELINEQLEARNILGLEYIFSEVTSTEDIIKNPKVKGKTISILTQKEFHSQAVIEQDQS
jgi:succinate-semialdehyde dehydrogenase/glutarate-semialdehyde dehydrogenase